MQFKTIIFIILLLILSALSLITGVTDISLAELANLDSVKYSTLMIARIPRTATLILAGIGLSVSGLIMQQIMQNRFVSPTTGGTLDAAKMGLLASYIFFPQNNLGIKLLLAFVFTFIESIIFLFIVNRIRFRNIIFIPLVGLMFGGIVSSIATFFAYKYNIVQNINSWMTGDFSSVLKGNYELIYLVLPVVACTYLYAVRFTVAGLGEASAKSLGINYKGIIMLGMFFVSITVSCIFVVVGSIPFLGLVAPNIIRLLYGDHLRKTLPLIALFGAVFLLACDIIGRIVIAPYEVPIGIIVGIFGAVIFLFLLHRTKYK